MTLRRGDPPVRAPRCSVHRTRRAGAVGSPPRALTFAQGDGGRGVAVCAATMDGRRMAPTRDEDRGRRRDATGRGSRAAVPVVFSLWSCSLRFSYRLPRKPVETDDGCPCHLLFSTFFCGKCLFLAPLPPLPVVGRGRVVARCYLVSLAVVSFSRDFKTLSFVSRSLLLFSRFPF